MLTSDRQHWNSRKSSTRLPIAVEQKPRSVQIAGSDPSQLADAAKAVVDLGAHIVDINMGCPAKKVCNRAAGSALMRDEPLVECILRSVVNAVDVPVTLKTRTGWDTKNRNGVAIAKIAEDAGIQMLTVHGRTRACRFNGDAEYETIAEIARSVSIPVVANGDIGSAKKALHVLSETDAAGLMLGRGAMGKPWLFGEIQSAIEGKPFSPPSRQQKFEILLRHLELIHSYYEDVTGNELLGVRLARKHIGWYLEEIQLNKKIDRKEFTKFFNQLESANEQIHAINLLYQNATLPFEREQGLAA